MNVTRFAMAAGFIVLCAGLGRASTLEPGHFIVNLNDDCSTDPTNPECSVTNDPTGGWGDDTTFNTEVNPGLSTRGFTTSSCVDPDHDHDCDATDPSIRIDPGGGSSPFPVSFSSDANGGGIFDFQNDTSSPYTELLFISKWNPNEDYTCAFSGGLFDFCGFKVVSAGQGNFNIEALFAGGDIPSAVPEPSEYVFLLGACAAGVWIRRSRSRRASV